MKPPPETVKKLSHERYCPTSTLDRVPWRVHKSGFGGVGKTDEKAVSQYRRGGAQEECQPRHNGKAIATHAPQGSRLPWA
jgi:hypothetical protein